MKWLHFVKPEFITFTFMHHAPNTEHQELWIMIASPFHSITACYASTPRNMLCSSSSLQSTPRGRLSTQGTARGHRFTWPPPMAFPQIVILSKFRNSWVGLNYCRLFNLPLGSRLSFCLFVQSSPREKRGESYPREFARLSQLNPNQLWRELERMLFLGIKFHVLPFKIVLNIA